MKGLLVFVCVLFGLVGHAMGETKRGVSTSLYGLAFDVVVLKYAQPLMGDLGIMARYGSAQGSPYGLGLMMTYSLSYEGSGSWMADRTDYYAGVGVNRNSSSTSDLPTDFMYGFGARGSWDSFFYELTLTSVSNHFPEVSEGVAKNYAYGGGVDLGMGYLF